MRNLGFISEGGRDVRSGNGRGRDAIMRNRRKSANVAAANAAPSPTRPRRHVAQVWRKPRRQQ
jgi:hypothetical protein